MNMETLLKWDCFSTRFFLHKPLHHNVYIYNVPHQVSLPVISSVWVQNGANFESFRWDLALTLTFHTGTARARRLEAPPETSQMWSGPTRMS